MASQSTLAMDLAPLVDGEVICTEEELLQVSEDFGHLVQRTPKVLVKPRSAEGVARILQYANQQSIPVSTRGEAHSQTGQSLVQDGIVIGTRELNKIGSFDTQTHSVWVGGGTVWGDLVQRLDPEGLVPRVLTNNLSVTVGGTLSVAGLGVSSFRYGAQGDNVDALEVVTPTGELVNCSPENEADLFNLVRSGLGQFGIITRAQIRTRAQLPLNRTYMLLYDSLEAILADSRKVMQEDHFDDLES
jgi:cytokinin dehydrogenase